LNVYIITLLSSTKTNAFCILRYIESSIIVPKEAPVHRRIVRVELSVVGTVVEFEVGSKLEHGCFRLDLNAHPELLGTDLALNIFAWDDTFNCVASIERFILQGGCVQ